MLEIDGLTVAYGARLALRDFSLSMKEGEIVALVGESGSGKTTAIRSILGLLPPSGAVTEGTIALEGQQLQNFSPWEWQALRGKKLSMIFQDSGAMLNPIRTIGSQFREYIRTHGGCSKKEAGALSKEMLERMGLSDPESILGAYPFQLSGGQRQREGIAMAMTFQPKLLLADEPTSALDVTTQAQIVRQMLELRDTYGTAILLVTHNLAVAAYMADHILVMRNGSTVEQGNGESLLQSQEPYTRQLLQAVPALGGKRYV